MSPKTYVFSSPSHSMPINPSESSTSLLCLSNKHKNSLFNTNTSAHGNKIVEQTPPILKLFFKQPIDFAGIYYLTVNQTLQIPDNLHHASVNIDSVRVHSHGSEWPEARDAKRYGSGRPSHVGLELRIQSKHELWKFHPRKKRSGTRELTCASVRRRLIARIWGGLLKIWRINSVTALSHCGASFACVSAVESRLLSSKVQRNEIKLCLITVRGGSGGAIKKKNQKKGYCGKIIDDDNTLELWAWTTGLSHFAVRWNSVENIFWCSPSKTEPELVFSMFTAASVVCLRPHGNSWGRWDRRYGINIRRGVMQPISFCVCADRLRLHLDASALSYD